MQRIQQGHVQSPPEVTSTHNVHSVSPTALQESSFLRQSHGGKHFIAPYFYFTYLGSHTEEQTNPVKRDTLLSKIDCFFMENSIIHERFFQV